LDAGDVLTKLQKLGKTSKERIIKRRKRRRRRAIFLLVFLISAVTLYILFTSPFFILWNIDCSGNNKLASDEIVQKSSLKLGTKIFQNKLFLARKKILDFSYVKNVKIKRNLPDTIQIEITERVPFAKIRVGDEILIFDSEGIIIDTACVNKSEKFVNLIEFFGLNVGSTELKKNIVNETPEIQKFEICKTFVSELTKQNLSDKIKTIDISDENKVKLNYDDKIFVNIGNCENIPYKIRFLKQVLSENLQGELGNLNYINNEFHFISNRK
jgi:cell division protein FtsQ